MNFLATEIAWLAGFFEGEGSVGIYERKSGAGCFVCLKISQQNSESLVKCYDITKMGNVQGPYKTKTGSIMFWSVSKMGDVYKIIKLIYPWLSERRQTQCDVVLEYIESTTKFKRLNKEN